MYNLIIRPLLFCIDPEKVHRMLLSWLKFYRYLFPVRACVRGYSRVSDPFSYGHLQFKNRIGLSAGFDKNAEAFDELADFGFGFLEVGTVTPDSQSGNPSPRIFRLVDDESLISRTGFNNCGVDAVRQHIRKYRKHSYVLGVNINKNPLSTGDQIVKDFESTFIHLYDCVDYFTLNWGSIDNDLFAMVLEKLTIFRQAANKRCNIFIKLPADIDEKALDTVISLAYKYSIEGFIATGPTRDRSGLHQAETKQLEKIGNGGVSGRGIGKKSQEVVRYLSEHTDRHFLIIGAGGIMTAEGRATGKTTLFDAAVKATDFLCHFYETASAELARNAICPSHYMGVVEMYRATGNPRYLELSKNLIDIRGMVENGTDDNQDRIPFRDQYRAMGHAVRANYLYAGVADVYAETGEQQLMKNLTSIWNDIVTQKMYVTGACGALYDGTSPDGTCYEPDSIQKVHQSYGRPYQLPNSTAHNETCANIGNMLFNWRMLEVTGDAKYADLVETCLYNSVLSGISLDGKKYFYTNPLRISADLPYTLRWPKERTEYISCFCCPPNTLRTLCQAQNYAYTLSPEGIYCNLYGANTLTTTWKDKGELALTQETDYPWEGKVRVTLDRVPRKAGTFSLFLRIPEWCEKTTLTVNGQPLQTNTKANSYAEVNRTWKKGDVVELVMDMPVRLLEAHPLAEEIRNQVVVKRGPLVYCLESMDIANGEKIDNVLIPADIKLTPKKITIEGSPIVALEGMARLASATSWEGVLYRPVVQAEKTVNIRLIPYYAWGNRGKGEMTVWMPLAR